MTPAHLPPQTTTSMVEAPWGCRVESQSTNTEEGRIDFSNITRHIRNLSECKCRRNLDPMQEITNEEIVARHAHNLWTSGKCDLMKMLNIFANLKLGLHVAEEFQLHWDEENKVWGETPQRGKSPGGLKDVRSHRKADTLAIQVSSEDNKEITIQCETNAQAADDGNEASQCKDSAYGNLGFPAQLKLPDVTHRQNKQKQVGEDIGDSTADEKPFRVNAIRRNIEVPKPMNGIAAENGNKDDSDIPEDDKGG
ncbi:hypothetical protein F4782DRAFT_531032 [Xylaria castorea]|nr:hypothetical protein F4782DRAFT_531032 [Xylaria castorea]